MLAAARSSSSVSTHISRSSHLASERDNRSRDGSQLLELGLGGMSVTPRPSGAAST